MCGTYSMHRRDGEWILVINPEEHRWEENINMLPFLRHPRCLQRLPGDSFIAGLVRLSSARFGSARHGTEKTPLRL
jgi:hypothetical protein